tara:strand:+ start:464 stop:817 length:354 start_codon:yes stop_codon:yes gene_type:complete
MKSLLVGVGICASLFPFAPVESREPEPQRCEVYAYPRKCKIIENNNFLIIKTYLPDLHSDGDYTLVKNADGTFSDAEDGAVWRRKSSSTVVTYYATKCTVFRGAKQCIPFEIKIWNN